MATAVRVARPGPALPVGRGAAGLVVPLAALVLWALASRLGWLPEQVLPPPTTVGLTLLDLASSGELAEHASISLLRVIQGFLLGAAVGLVLGTAMGLWPAVDEFARPLFLAVAAVPALGWIPLLILLVGIDETLKVLVIAKAALVPVTLNTQAGIRGVPRALVEVGEVFRYDRLQALRRIVLPAAVPPVFTGIRYGLTHAWLALVAVELLASSEGLGYLLVWGRQMFWLDTVIAAMAVIGVVGLVMDRGLAAVEARLQRWRAEDG